MKDSHLIEQCEQNMKSSLKSPVTKVQKVEVFKLEMIPNETDTSSAIFFWQDSKCLEPILCQETSWFLEDRTASLTFCYSKESIYTLCCYAQKKTQSIFHNKFEIYRKYSSMEAMEGVKWFYLKSLLTFSSVHFRCERQMQCPG